MAATVRILGSVLRIFVLPATLLMVFALGGCSSEATASSSSQPPATPVADVRPWTSVIAQQASALTKSQKGLDDLSCSAGSAGASPCSALYVARSFDMQTIALSLDSATNPSAKTYLGDTPAEMSSRYAATVAVAKVASDAGEAWSSKCVTSTSVKCHGIAFKFDQAVSALQSDFDAWTPYL